MTYVSIPAPIIDGSPVAADSAKLSDPTGTYGIRNAATLQVAVADGTDLNFVNGDTYEFEFMGDDSITYQVAFELVVDGETFWSSATVQGSTPAPANTLKLSFMAIDRGEIVDFGYDDLPKLENQAATFGVKRTDTDAVVLATGHEMVESGVGIYSKIFYIPDEQDLVYKFYVHVVVNGIEYYIPSISISPTSSLNSVMLAIGRYTNSYEIGKRFGFDNVHKWLSLPMGDTDDPIDYAKRAYEFIAQAEAAIDDKTRGVYYDPPYDNEYEEVPDIIKRCATALAGVAMYEARGVDDVNAETNEPFHRLRYVRKDTIDTLKRIAMGRISIDTRAAVKPIRNPVSGGSSVVKYDERHT